MTNSNSRLHTVKILSNFDESNQRLSIISNQYLTTNLPSFRHNQTITFLTQEVMRWRGYLDFILTKRYHGKFYDLDILTQNILRLGAYEVIFRSSVPQYASINSIVQLSKQLNRGKLAGVINAILRQLSPSLKPDPFYLTKNTPINELAAHLSHPSWMIKRWISQYGFDKMVELCLWNNRAPRYTIRRNRLQVDQETFESWLNKQKVHWVRSRLDSHFYMIDQLSKLRSGQKFNEGYFTFQDLSAGMVSKLNMIHSFKKFLDVCAAPGGKITYISELMGNKGSLYAYDIDENRLEKLRENVKRLHLRNIHIALKDATFDDYPVSDCILVDAPCSGTGVMAKRADVKWRRKEKNIHEMAMLQKRILFHISQFVTVGGKIIYATCSLEEEENWGVIHAFLSRHHNFQIVKPDSAKFPGLIDERGAFKTFPPCHKMDGVFAIILNRLV